MMSPHDCLTCFVPIPWSGICPRCGARYPAVAAEGEDNYADAPQEPADEATE